MKTTGAPRTRRHRIQHRVLAFFVLALTIVPTTTGASGAEKYRAGEEGTGTLADAATAGGVKWADDALEAAVIGLRAGGEAGRGTAASVAAALIAAGAAQDGHGRTLRDGSCAALFDRLLSKLGVERTGAGGLSSGYSGSGSAEERGWSCELIHVVAAASHPVVMRLLLEHGARADAVVTSPAMEASSSEPGRGSTALHVAAAQPADVDEDGAGVTEDDIVEIIEALLGSLDAAHLPALIDAEDAVGRTPLFYAAMADNGGAVRLLASRGADANGEHVLSEYYGRAPLVAHAVLYGASKALAALLEAGAGTDWSTEVGRCAGCQHQNQC